MRQKLITVIAISIFAGVFLSILADKYLFSNAASNNTEVDVVPVIKTDFPLPSSKYFNPQAIDPTQIVNIGPNSSQQPFNNGQ